MNIKVIVIAISLLFVVPAFADKPGWTGKGKPTAEQKESHKSTMNAKVGDEESDDKEMLKDKEQKSNKSDKQKNKKNKKK